MKFQQHKMTTSALNKAITSASKQLITATDEVQKVILACAAQIEEHGNCDGLTKLVTALSTVNEEGKVVLSSHAKQIGLYVHEHLPTKWDKETQVFKLKKEAAKEFDYETAALNMAVRWDQFGKQKADSAFDEVRNLRKAVNSIKAILGEDHGSMDRRVVEEAKYLMDKMNRSITLLKAISDERRGKASNDVAESTAEIAARLAEKAEQAAAPVAKTA